jgi:hypothetical protein
LFPGFLAGTHCRAERLGSGFIFSTAEGQVPWSVVEKRLERLHSFDALANVLSRALGLLVRACQPSLGLFALAHWQVSQLNLRVDPADLHHLLV